MLSKIKIFGLGGLSESGKNSYVVEVDDEIYVFDAGIKFASGNLLGIDYIMPGGGAYLGRLSVGDIITHINGASVSAIEQMHHMFMVLQPDTIVRISGITKSGEEFSSAVYLQDRPRSPGYEIYRHDLIAKSMLPIFGMSLTSVGKSEYVVSSVLKGSIADESGFSENDPIRIRNIEFSEKNDAMFVSIYAKKRKNGYLDINLGIAAPLDSSLYF